MATVQESRAYDVEKWKADNKARIERATDTILAKMQASDMPEFIAKTLIHTTGKPSDSWSLGNLIVMHYIGNTTDGRTYEGWHKVGRQVKQGAKAFYILEPDKVSFSKLLCPECKKPLDPDNACINQACKAYNMPSAQPVKHDVQLLRFKASPRFRIEDTDIVDSEKWKVANTEFKPRSIPPLLQVAEDLGIRVSYRNSQHGEYGATDTENNIYLSTESVDTFFHELTHVVHAKLETLKPGQDPEAEAIAQLSACTLASLYGYDAIPYTMAYLANYSENQTKESTLRLAMKVLKKVKVILEIILAENNEKRQALIVQNKGFGKSAEGTT